MSRPPQGGQPRRSALPWPTAPSGSSRTRRSLVAFAGQAPGSGVSPDPPGSGAAPSSTSLASQSASSACRRCTGLSLAIPVNQSSNSALFTPTSAKSELRRIAKPTANAISAKNAHWGSTLDDFLDEEGLREAAKTEAATRLIAFQLGQEMERQGMSKARLAELMHSSLTLLAMTDAAASRIKNRSFSIPRFPRRNASARMGGLDQRFERVQRDALVSLPKRLRAPPPPPPFGRSPSPAPLRCAGEDSAPAPAISSPVKRQRNGGGGPRAAWWRGQDLKPTAAWELPLDPIADREFMAFREFLDGRQKPDEELIMRFERCACAFGVVRHRATRQKTRPGASPLDPKR